MDNEVLHLHAGMTEDDVIQRIAATMWEASSAAVRQHLEDLAARFGYDDVLEYLCQHVRDERQRFPTLEACLDTLPGRLQ